jgi:hypothetical protein
MVDDGGEFVPRSLVTMLKGDQDCGCTGKANEALSQGHGDIL